MRRKYDIRNKRNFIIVVIIAIITIGIFSLFIYNYKKISKIEYIVKAGSIIQDTDKNYISLDDDAVIKYRFSGNYYLKYQDKDITLSKRVVAYNSLTGEMKLFGKFYEINEDGKIIEHKDETILPNTTESKFYKLADREYLLVDSTIKSNDGSLDTSAYLLVELDKLGNAKLSNEKINLKTINPTTLVTTKYQFDINNEILNFGKYDINLKKIIGSSNQYVEEVKEEKQLEENNNGSGEGGGGGTGSGGTGTGIGTGGGNNQSGEVINTGGVGDSTEQTDEILDKVKMTSVVRVSEGMNTIDIDYVVYDPYNEYKSIYAEVLKNNKLEVVYLSKTDTHLLIEGLNPDTEYTISFVYTTINSETNEIERTTFDRLDLKTKKPVYNIEVYGISNIKKTITYKVYLQPGYNVNKINTNLEFSYLEFDTESNSIIKKKGILNDSVIVNNINSKYIIGTISIDGYNIDTTEMLKLNIESVEGTSGIIPITSSYSFRIEV